MLASFVFLGFGYCWKTGISLLPDISDEVGEGAGQSESSPLQLPNWLDMRNETNRRIGDALFDIFLTVRQETESQMCDVRNIFGGMPNENPKMHISQIHMHEDIKQSVLTVIGQDKNVATVIHL